jgi:hypothetical protein
MPCYNTEIYAWEREQVTAVQLDSRCKISIDQKSDIMNIIKNRVINFTCETPIIRGLLEESITRIRKYKKKYYNL